MKTTKATAALVISKPDEPKARDETPNVQNARNAMTFKGTSLEDLLKEAAELQSLIALSRPWDICDLDATYDVTSGEWTGRLYELF